MFCPRFSRSFRTIFRNVLIFLSLIFLSSNPALRVLSSEPADFVVNVGGASI